MASLQLLSFASGAVAVKCLVYGILLEKDTVRASLPDTREMGRITILAEGAIGAVCSFLPAAVTTPEVSQLLEYAGVINAVFERITLLPMRFGCWLDGEQELRHLLDRKRDTFRAQLERLDGCAELGIRVMPSPSSGPDKNAPAAETPIAGPERTNGEGRDHEATLPHRSGASYLLNRVDRYRRADLQKDAFERLTQRIQDALAGLYVQSVATRDVVRQNGLWSWHFLVRRQDIERFREACGTLQTTLSHPLLLTGPWPPYNFVAEGT